MNLVTRRRATSPAATRQSRTMRFISRLGHVVQGVVILRVPLLDYFSLGYIFFPKRFWVFHLPTVCVYTADRQTKIVISRCRMPSRDLIATAPDFVSIDIYVIAAWCPLSFGKMLSVSNYGVAQLLTFPSSASWVIIRNSWKVIVTKMRLQLRDCLSLPKGAKDKKSCLFVLRNILE